MARGRVARASDRILERATGRGRGSGDTGRPAQTGGAEPQRSKRMVDGTRGDGTKAERLEPARRGDDVHAVAVSLQDSTPPLQRSGADRGRNADRRTQSPGTGKVDR